MRSNPVYVKHINKGLGHIETVKGEYCNFDGVRIIILSIFYFSSNITNIKLNLFVTMHWYHIWFMPTEIYGVQHFRCSFHSLPGPQTLRMLKLKSMFTNDTKMESANDGFFIHIYNKDGVIWQFLYPYLQQRRGNMDSFFIHIYNKDGVIWRFLYPYLQQTQGYMTVSLSTSTTKTG